MYHSIVTVTPVSYETVSGAVRKVPHTWEDNIHGGENVITGIGCRDSWSEAAVDFTGNMAG